MTKSQKKFDDSVNDKAKPEINDQSQIETRWAVPGGRRKMGRNHEQIQNIADDHGNQGFPEVRLKHLVRMPENPWMVDRGS